MKLDIVSALFGRPGGAENATQTLAEALIRRGVDVRVVGTRTAARRYPYAEVLPGSERIPTALVTYAWNPLFDAFFERRLAAYWRRRRPDVVLLEDHMLFLAAVRAVRKLNREGAAIKLVMSQIWDVDSRFYYDYRPRPMAWYLCRHFWRLNAMSREMDLVNAYISFHRDQLVELFGVDPNRIILAQTTSVDPVPLARPTLPPSPARFIAPGRLCPEKGAFFMLDAVERLLALTKDFELDYYGLGPSEKRLRAEIAKRGLERWVCVRGAVPRKDLWEAMSSASATCVPIMYAPGYTCVALESLSAGVPLIAFDHGGMPDLIDNGETGFRTPPRDAEAYAKAMYEFVRSPRLALDMEAACREKAAHIATAADGAETLHRALLERFGGAEPRMEVASAQR